MALPRRHEAIGSCALAQQIDGRFEMQGEAGTTCRVVFQA